MNKTIFSPTVNIHDSEIKKDVKMKGLPTQKNMVGATPKIDTKNEIDIASAQAVIAKEKEQRVQEFIEKLKALCQEYNISLTSGDIIVKAL